MKMRDSRFELLRVISMVMIVIYHLAFWGSPRVWNKVQPGGMFSADALLMTLGKSGAMIFVMIGAYFLVDKKYKSKRWIALFLETCLYTWLIFIIKYIATGTNPYGSWKVALLPFPFMLDAYWFILIYLVILMVSPILNMVVNQLTQKQLGVTIFVGIMLWSALYNYLLYFGTPDGNTRFSPGTAFFGGTEQTFYLLVYLIIAYIKRYASYHPNTLGSRKSSIIFAISYIIVYEVANVFLAYKGISLFKHGWDGTCSITTLLFALSLFLVIYHSKPFYSGMINWLSASGLAVYLLSENSLLRPMIWHLVNAEMFNGRPLIYLMYAILSGILIYLFSTAFFYLVTAIFGGKLDEVSNILGAKLDKFLMDH